MFYLGRWPGVVPVQRRINRLVCTSVAFAVGPVCCSTNLYVCSVHRFSVGVFPGTKLESGPATLHLCNNLLALARDVPPVVIGHWNLPDLRRYGPVPNGFVFEGGTRCGYCEFCYITFLQVYQHCLFSSMTWYLASGGQFISSTKAQGEA